MFDELVKLHATDAWHWYLRSMRDASCCGKCGAAIAAGQRVTGGCVDFRTSRGTVHRWTRFCDDCAERDHRPPMGPPDPSDVFECAWFKRDPWEGWHERACESCARPVRLPKRPDYWMPRQPHVWCCERCREHWYNARRKKAKPTPKRCTVCHTRFTPLRSDATLCSDACKQKAYRQRHKRQR